MTRVALDRVRDAVYRARWGEGAAVSAAARRAWSTGLGLLGTGLALAAGMLLLLGLSAPWPDSAWGPRGALYPAMVGLPTIGWLLTRRRPDNPVGWLLAGSGISLCLNYVGLGVAVLAHDRGASTWAAWAAWVVEWAWVPGIVLLLAALIRFPSGALPRPGRRVVRVALVVGLLGPSLHEAMKPGRLDNVAWYAKPLPVADPTWALVGPVLGATYLGLVAVLLGALANLVGGFVRARGVVRQQLRWVVYASLPFVGTLLLLASLEGAGVASDGAAVEGVVLANSLSAPLLVGAVAVAILHHRLYDLDRLLSRTAVYLLLMLLLGGVYVVLVVTLQWLLRPLTPGSDLAVAGSTLAIVALVQPVRRRLQDVVDRRFGRRRHDARQTVDAFAARLRDEVDLDALQTDLHEVVTATVAPTHARLWVAPEAPTPGSAPPRRS